MERVMRQLPPLSALATSRASPWQTIPTSTTTPSRCWTNSSGGPTRSRKAAPATGSPRQPEFWSPRDRQKWATTVPIPAYGSLVFAVLGGYVAFRVGQWRLRKQRRAPPGSRRLIKLQGAWYHYCSIPQATVAAL